VIYRLLAAVAIVVVVLVATPPEAAAQCEGGVCRLPTRSVRSAPSRPAVRPMARPYRPLFGWRRR